MKQRLCLLLLLTGLATVAASGCCRNRCCYPSCAAPCDPCAPSRLRPSQALMPVRSDPVIGPGPANRVDVMPPAAATLPGMSPMQPQPPSPPSPISPADVRSYGPPPTPPEPTWRPSPDATPSPTPAEPSRDPVRLFPPESPKPPQATPPQDTGPDRTPSPALPTGIRQYATVRERLAAGLKPSLDGLDWLKNNGYRTVLLIRRPDADDAADRRQVEDRRGMKFISLEVSPESLREASEKFNRLAADNASLPMFVYDQDGSLQGILWYLQFKMVDLDSDGQARIRAGQLGLREDGSPEIKEMWIAVQKLLSER